jgi:hypothetical protein
MAADTHALSYRHHDSFYFLPTDPEKRKWRGPFQNEFLMQRAMRNELGADVAETRTLVRPEFLK